MRFVPFVALAAIAVGSAAIAQTAPAGGQPDRAARWQAHKADFEAHVAAMQKQRGDDIALLIGLRADQRPAFDAMMAAMERPHHGPGEGGSERGPRGATPAIPQDQSTTARLDSMSAHIDARSADEKAKLAALKSFYASLTADQRLRFDALDRLRHEHGDMGRHGDHGPDGPGGPGAPPPGE